MMIENIFLVFSALFVAGAMYYGARQCVVREEDKHANPKKKFLKGIYWCLAVDATVLVVNHFLGFPNLPLIAAAAQFGVGATLISAGCM